MAIITLTMVFFLLTIACVGIVIGGNRFSDGEVEQMKPQNNNDTKGKTRKGKSAR